MVIMQYFDFLTTLLFQNRELCEQSEDELSYGNVETEPSCKQDILFFADEPEINFLIQPSVYVKEIYNNQHKAFS